MYQQVIDQLICELYNKFYKKNKKLFESNGVEYWRQATQYKESQLRIELTKAKYQKLIKSQ